MAASAQTQGTVSSLTRSPGLTSYMAPAQPTSRSGGLSVGQELLLEKPQALEEVTSV